MLVNLTPKEEEIARRRGIAEQENFPYAPQGDPKYVIEKGIYRDRCDFNFALDEFEETCGTEFKRSLLGVSRWMQGVADNVEQIKEHYKKEIEDPTAKYVITITPVFQVDQDPVGGWRWHKWGTYIGVLEPKYEYLYDEDFGKDFEYVLTYSVYRID